MKWLEDMGDYKEVTEEESYASFFLPFRSDSETEFAKSSDRFLTS